MREALKIAALSLVLAVGFACGGEDEGGTGKPGPGGSNATITKQQRISLEEFAALAAADAELAELAATLTLSSAGVVTDSDGVDVVWAEGVDSKGATRTAVRACSKAGCTSALQSLDGGQAKWEHVDQSGATPVSVGQPPLLKDLVGQDLSGITTVSSALTQSWIILDKAALPVVDFAARRFVALNTFGALHSTRTSAVTTSVKGSGLFDEVESIDYAREQDVVEAFEGLDGLDAVLWLTQAVRQEKKDGWRESATVGLTVNRGGYGETMMDRDAIAAARAGNVGAGPGLIFLAASNSNGDGSPNQPGPGTVWSKLDYDDRILIGVEGPVSVDQILSAATKFFDLFLSGDATVADAIEAANGALPAGTRLVSNPSSATRRWTGTGEDVLATRPFTPSNTRLITPITAVPRCGLPGQQKKDAVNAPDAQPFADVTFDGLHFTGRKLSESRTYPIDTNYRGSVTGFAEGDRVLLEVWGTFNPQFQDFHAFGEGVIVETELNDKDGTWHVRFRGLVHAAPYMNAEGEECLMNSPQLQTKTSGLSEFVFTP
ncbi:MAG: hypothetical protein R3F39_17820 [Myxococcota bacterium]